MLGQKDWLSFRWLKNTRSLNNFMKKIRIWKSFFKFFKFLLFHFLYLIESFEPNPWEFFLHQVHKFDTMNKPTNHQVPSQKLSNAYIYITDSSARLVLQLYLNQQQAHIHREECLVLFVDFSHVKWEKRWVEKNQSKWEMDFAEKQKQKIRNTRISERVSEWERITVVYFDCKCLFTEAIKKLHFSFAKIKLLKLFK